MLGAPAGAGDGGGVGTDGAGTGAGIGATDPVTHVLHFLVDGGVPFFRWHACALWICEWSKVKKSHPAVAPHALQQAAGDGASSFLNATTLVEPLRQVDASVHAGDDAALARVSPARSNGARTMKDAERRKRRSYQRQIH